MDGYKVCTLRPLQATAVTHPIAFAPHAGRKVLTLRGAMPQEGIHPKSDWWKSDLQVLRQHRVACAHFGGVYSGWLYFQNIWNDLVQAAPGLLD